MIKKSRTDRRWECIWHIRYNFLMTQREYFLPTLVEYEILEIELFVWEKKLEM